MNMRVNQSPATTSYSEEQLSSLTLDEQGVIRDCTNVDERLFGYPREELISHHISLLLPQLANTALLDKGEINPCLHYRCRIGTPFKAICHGGDCLKLKISFILFGSPNAPRLRMFVFPL